MTPVPLRGETLDESSELGRPSKSGSLPWRFGLESLSRISNVPVLDSGPPLAWSSAFSWASGGTVDTISLL